MKYLLASTLLFNCFLGGLSANDFDNWYFDYFSDPVTSSGKFEAPDGRHVETSTGVQTGKVSEDGKTFTQTAKFEYKNQGTKVEATLRWTRTGDDSFKGTYKDSNGTTVTYSLVLKEGKRFQVESTAPNGVQMVSDGRLDDAGVIRSSDKMTAPDGQLIVSITTEMKKKKKVEQGGAGEPATRSKSDSEGGDKPQPEEEGRSR